MENATFNWLYGHAFIRVISIFPNPYFPPPPPHKKKKEKEEQTTRGERSEDFPSPPPSLHSAHNFAAVVRQRFVHDIS